MDTDIFDGYTGIRLGGGQSAHDFLLLTLLIVFALFSLIFGYYYPLFVKMWNDMLSLKERRSLFDTEVKGNVFFNTFMQFQAIFLITIFAFLVYSHYIGVNQPDIGTVLSGFAVIFCITAVYYFFKQLIYHIYGRLFNDSGEFRLWSSNYFTIFYIWEVLIYIPCLLLIFDYQYITAAIIIFAASYILFRIAVIYVTIRIFYDKNAGFLFLSSYLCAQEIIPPLFLYEGLKYLHNIIQISTLWH